LGELNPKFTASASIGFNANRTVHSFDGLQNDRKANAAARIFQIRVKAFKNIPNLSLVFGWNPNAIILDPKSNLFTSSFRPNMNTRLFFRQHELQSIRN